MRNKKFLTALFTVISALCIILPAGTHAEDKIPVAVVKSSVYDFGVAYEGNTVAHEFIIKNTGNADLEISQIKCG